MRAEVSKVCLAIAGIGDRSEDGVQVLLPGGGSLWLPRRHAEFYPGRVYIPAWLARKLAAYIGACAPVKAPARAVTPSA